MSRREVIGILATLLVVVVPLVGVTIEGSTRQSVWIVKADDSDASCNLAVETLLAETAGAELDIRLTSLSRLRQVPSHADVLVVVGHGELDGLRVSSSLITWCDLYGTIAECSPVESIILACNSPTDASSRIFGFEGLVDAEAGAVMVGWYLNRLGDPRDKSAFPFDRVAKAQRVMKNPLGRYLYFVHGYWGSNAGFEGMRDYFRESGLFVTDYNESNVRFFSYFDYYNATTEIEKNLVHWLHTISEFAINLYNDLASLPADSQVTIVGHSLGGIITREMLRLRRSDLDNAGIAVGKVITLGTPHGGTNLANHLAIWDLIASLIGGYLITAHLWPSPVFSCVAPLSPFMISLNWDPLNYSSGIEWYTISGYEALASAAVFVFHGDSSDPVVAVGRAHLPFASQEHFNVGHGALIEDPSETTYSTVLNWTRFGVDSDGDGLTDDSETYFHGTNPDAWDSDGDGIGDADEILWGYDPLDSSSPIPATLLISSVLVVSSTRNVEVYVNHYDAMDFVKFYVRYKTKTGSWTGSYYMGVDYTADTGGDYYRSWTHPTGYVEMKVMVAAYDVQGHWLGCDYGYVPISDGGGGGQPPID